MEKRIKEAVRYLGFGKNAADERTLSLIGEAFADLEKEADPRFVCRFFDITHEADGKIRIGTLKISSRSLERNLKGCGKIVLFGATLGPGVDRLITRTSVMDMAKAVIVQACAAAMLEEYCDSRQDHRADHDGQLYDEPLQISYRRDRREQNAGALPRGRMRGMQ